MKRRDLRDAAEMLAKAAGGKIDCALILGSGIGSAFDVALGSAGLAYGEVPGMPEPSVAGHSGRVLFGTIGGRRVVAFSGRFHLYEGYEPREVTYPIAVAAAAGASTCILTNAAGSLNPQFTAGDLMLIVDHLNLTGRNPLAGPRPLHDGRTRFVDLADAYSPELRGLAMQAAAETDIVLRRGIYAAVLGPTYETPAEANMIRALGADAVGMSTVLETIAARALDVRVLAFSALTNAVGASTTHESVLEHARAAAHRIAILVERILASERFEANLAPLSDGETPART